VSPLNFDFVADNQQNNWNAFGCDVSEDLLYTTSEQILTLGLRDLGYDHVVLDDCWQDVNGRDENGKLQPELSKFPNGLRSISDHLHQCWRDDMRTFLYVTSHY
jgi:alpha-galactosidase